MADEISSSHEVTVNPATQLAGERTYLAHDRTLMAWTRTSASLTSFGFALYKFFEGSLAERTQRHPLGYRTFSLAMIGIGVVVLILATLQHRRDTKELEDEFRLKPRYLATITAALIGGLGALGLAAVLLRQ
jgi:putative membrane protein